MVESLAISKKIISLLSPLIRIGIAVLILFITISGARLVFYYIWNATYLWFLQFLVLSFLLFATLITIEGISLYKKVASHRRWKIFFHSMVLWAVAEILLSLWLVAPSYDSRTAEFLWRLKEAKSGNQVASLSSLTPFAWEKACFFGPYTSDRSIRESIGTAYVLEHVDTNNEGLSYAVFALPDKHTLIVGVPRYLFEVLGDPRCVTYKEAGQFLLQ